MNILNALEAQTILQFPDLTQSRRRMAFRRLHRVSSWHHADAYPQQYPCSSPLGHCNPYPTR